MTLPVMTLTQAKKLAGKRFRVGGKEFLFDDDVKAGGQAIAIPLKNSDGERVAFFRSLFAMAATPAKMERTSWMIGQRLHLLSAAFMGAPQLWVNTESQGRPAGVEFDFAGTVHGIALGTSWKSWKEDVEMGLRNEPSLDLRCQLAKGLIQRLACLEAVGRSGFVHGDISDANVMLDDASGRVNLIDFDCFVFDSPTLNRPKLTIRDGGSKGTPGYIPDWLSEDSSVDLSPLGDRFARDMMLIEILGFREGDPIDLSPLYWTGQEELLDDIKTLATSLKLNHLQSMHAFEANESERPSSFELANKLGLTVENNVTQTLSSEPVSPNASLQKGAKPVTNGTDPQVTASPAFSFDIPEVKDVPSILLRQVDRAAIQIGRTILPLAKTALLFVLVIVLMLVWVFVFTWLFLNVNVPLNLVLCGADVYGTFTCIKNSKVIRKHLRV